MNEKIFTCKKLQIFQEDKILVDISFSIRDSLALVGQSGSGKSLTLKALLEMLPDDLSSSLHINSDFQPIKGKNLAFVPQNPFTSLSSMTKIKDQFFKKEDEIKRFLKLVGLEEELMYRFPPELSGGQLQRVVIAIALSMEPKLLLMDEPTTALDANTREKILQLIHAMQKKYAFKLLFVTHDMDSAKFICEDVAILKNGNIIESGKMEDIIKNPSSPYTKELIEAGFKTRGFRE